MHLCVRSQLDGGTEEGQVQNAAVSLVESVFLPWVWRHKSLSRKKKIHMYYVFNYDLQHVFIYQMNKLQRQRSSWWS
jgi:hypothetical protein